MQELVNIAHPFQTVEEFQRHAGRRLGRLIHRLADKYPQLVSRCGVKRVLMAVSVAWGLSTVAKAGNVEAFAHIDDALQPQISLGCMKVPIGGYVMVAGEPFFIRPEEQPMLRFLWDGFAIFIDDEGVGAVNQVFFDLADHRQSKAYSVMGEFLSSEHQFDKELTTGNQDSEKQSTENLSNPQSKKTNINSIESSEAARILLEENILEGKLEKNVLEGKLGQNASEGKLEEVMNFSIDYACDIDRVDDAKVDAIKDLLEEMIDSPLAQSLSLEQTMTLAKRIRGIKRERCARVKVRREERMARCGATVNNNFFAPIAQQVFSAGMVNSTIEKNDELLDSFDRNNKID